MKIVQPIAVTDAILSSSNIPETEYGIYSALATYAAGDSVIVLSTHHIYKSLQAGNIGHDPVADSALETPLWWVNMGADNRWRMFDGASVNVSSAADLISCGLQMPVGNRADSIVLLNLDGVSAEVTVTDPVEGVVYDTTHSLISNLGITDWYSYFFEPIIRITELAVTDLPPYAAALIGVTINAAGQTVSCGELVVGLSKFIGNSQYGAQLGIQDYSVKQTDPFGNYTILQRAFSKKATFQVWVDAARVDSLNQLFADYRATPIVWIGADEYSSTIIYGFYKDFSVEIAYMEVSICSLEIEGLT